MSAEILRKINNLIVIGTVTESKSAQGLSLARVKVLERVTDFLPVMQISNSFKTHATPIRPGEQVVVLHPFGEGDSGVVLGSIFNKGQKEPSGYSATKEVTEYSDGTLISYDVASKTLEINAVATVNIICKNANITAETVHTGNVTIEGDLLVSGNVAAGKNLSVNENLSLNGTINDALGDLSNHTHSTTDGATALPR